MVLQTDISSDSETVFQSLSMKCHYQGPPLACKLQNINRRFILCYIRQYT